MYKTDESGEIVVFIMEPEEELLITRFIVLHKSVISDKEVRYWSDDCMIPISEQAQNLGLRGGYGVHFHSLDGGHFV